MRIGFCEVWRKRRRTQSTLEMRGKLHSIAHVRKAIMLCKTLAEVRADSVRRLKRIQRFFQNFLPASKVHVGHIEGFQLIVKLLRLRERGDGAVQMQPDACAPLLKGTFIAEKRTLRNTRRKIEGLL